MPWISPIIPTVSAAPLVVTASMEYLISVMPLDWSTAYQTITSEEMCVGWHILVTCTYVARAILINQKIELKVFLFNKTVHINMYSL